MSKAKDARLQSLDPKDAARVAAYTEVSTTGCWLWTASLTVRGGYAQMNVGGGKVVRVHRWLYASLVGPVDPSLDLDHLCRVRRCVNPDHLEPVSRAENLRRGIGNKRRATCSSGHALAGDNLYVRPGSGRKECLQCKNDRRSQC